MKKLIFLFSLVCCWECGVVANGGMVVAWGDNSSGQTNVPPGLTNVVTVSAGLDDCVALRADGTVVAWGANEYGQTNVPADLSNVVAISSGWLYNMALQGDGTVVTWGFPTTMVPEGLSNVVRIAAGGHQFCLALKADRTVAAWGYDGEGQIDVPPGLSNVVSIAAGLDHSLALRDDGTVVAWGGNTLGEIIVPPRLTNVVAVSAGWGQSYALRADGTVAGWGGDGYVPAGLSNVMAVAGAWDAGQRFLLADGTITGAPIGLSNVVSIAGGHFFAIAATGTGVPTFGAQNLESQTLPAGAGTLLSVGVAGGYPLTYQWQKDGTNIDGATNWFLRFADLQATNTGSYCVMVSNTWGAITSLTAVLTVVPSAPTIDVQPADVVSWPGGEAGCRVTAFGTAPRGYQWRLNGADIPGGTDTAIDLTALQAGQAGRYDVVVTNLSGSVTSQVAVLTLSPVVAWGENWSGKTLVPAESTNAIGVAGGTDFSLALRRDGTVVGWGDPASFGPTNLLQGLHDVIAVAAGGEHSLALRADGTVVAWGYNGSGQTNVPAGLSNVVAVAGGWNYSVALRSDGTVWAWGGNDFGQTNVPASASNVVAISAMGWNNLALRADGTVVAWGDNSEGQGSVPAGLSNVVAIAAGWYHSLALRRDGTVVAWGENSYGQTNVPPDLESVVAIGAGRNHSLALRGDGTLAAWGWDGNGQVDVPVELTHVVGIASAENHNLALVGSAAPVPGVPLTEPTRWNGVFTVSLPTQSGRVYVLEYKNSLSDKDWSALPLVAGNGRNLTLTDDSAAVGQRFYRVLKW